MIEEVLRSVREAEQKADEMKKQAEEKAAFIKAEADKSAADIIVGAKKNSKAARNNHLVSAGLTAENNYDETISASKKQCETIKISLDAKVESLSQEIFGRLKEWQ